MLDYKTSEFQNDSDCIQHINRMGLGSNIWAAGIHVAKMLLKVRSEHEKSIFFLIQSISPALQLVFQGHHKEGCREAAAGSSEQTWLLSYQGE